MVLVAGKTQCEYIRANTKHANAHYFPIGVDTAFFTPASGYKPYRLIHVGNNRRDFSTLITATDIVYQKFPQLELVLIGASASKNIIPERPYVRVDGYLDETEYLQILQSSNFALLSLEDGGSSNSLLETCACGLPLVATRLPNISDYLDDSFSLCFEKEDASALASAALRLLTEENLRNEMALAARKHAESYDWERIRASFEEILQEL